MEVLMTAKEATQQQVKIVKAERLTRDAFAPFGELLGLEGLKPLPINLYGDRITVHRPGYFESDQPVEFLLSSHKIRPFEVVFMERHLEITQTFIPLGGHPFISVVARPGAREEDGFPAAEEIHAFMVPGDAAINLHRGTWHEVPFPMNEGTLMLVTSHQALTRGLESKLSEKQEIYRLDVEKRNLRERTGCVLRIELP
jgi:ureidoglycolate lyase